MEGLKGSRRESITRTRFLSRARDEVELKPIAASQSLGSLFAPVAQSSNTSLRDTFTSGDTRTLRSVEEPLILAFEIFMFCILLYQAFEIPFRIAFDPLLSYNFNYLTVLALIDFCFIVDFVAGFFKPYLHPSGYMVTDKARIRRHYLKTWFIVDLISSIPWDYASLLVLQANPAGFQAQLFWIRYVICTRLVRVPKLMVQLKNWEITTNWKVSAIFFRATRIVIGLLLWLSTFSCIVNLIYDVEDSPIGWRVFLDPPAQAALSAGNAWIYYLNGLYWGIITFNTVCYGDFHANTAGERAWLFFYIWINIIFFAYITGSVVSWLQIRERKRVVTVTRLTEAKQYARLRGLPANFVTEMIRVVRFDSLARRIDSDDSKFLAELHPSLRSEAAEHLRDTLLRRWGFLQFLDLPSLSFLVCRVRTFQCHAGEDIIVEGSRGSKFFVLVSGRCSVRQQGRKVMEVSDSGSHFGELSLYDPECIRNFSVKTLVPCEMLTFSREDMDTVLEQFPKFQHNVHMYLEQIRRRELDVVTAEGGPSGDLASDFNIFTVDLSAQ